MARRSWAWAAIAAAGAAAAACGGQQEPENTGGGAGTSAAGAGGHADASAGSGGTAGDDGGGGTAADGAAGDAAGAGGDDGTAGGGGATGGAGGGSGGDDGAAGASGCGGGDAGGCKTDLDCPAPSKACFKAACSSCKCVEKVLADGTACETNKCLQGSTCKGGACQGGTVKDCKALTGPCQTGLCEVNTGTCKAVVKPNGEACTNNGKCTVGEKCTNGFCTGGTAKNCQPEAPVCHVGQCNPNTGLCEFQPKSSGACDDGNACTQSDQCQNGVCKGTNVTDGTKCDDKNACTTDDKCMAGQCTSTNAPDGTACDDKNDCTTGDKCLAGKCTATNAPDGTACDDGLPCTAPDKCQAGKCVGGSGIPVYFTESFANNKAGWTLGSDWEIGPAKGSTCGSYGNQDPDLDHSPSGDNGVAGVVLGGCIPSSPVHPLEYLESPKIDLSAATGAVWLSFYRWLNSDYTPFMTNTVEVWSGSQWVVLWQTGSSPGIQDDKWTFVSHDVTAHKNKDFKVRFGFSVSSGILTVTGWNVDDVVVAQVACP